MHSFLINLLPRTIPALSLRVEPFRAEAVLITCLSFQAVLIILDFNRLFLKNGTGAGFDMVRNYALHGSRGYPIDRWFERSITITG